IKSYVQLGKLLVFLIAIVLIVATLVVRSPLLEVDAQGALWVQGQPTTPEALRERLARLGARNPQAELQLRADQAVPYGRVAELMGWAHAAGLTRMGFVAEPARSQEGRSAAVLGPSGAGR
ncbi:ExbD/TolR family protein, partial [Delftia acidovorans]|uniref:ExbD/TolR family protein n=1 Tax=Delftia acidovorans TaxID=80866 RepID=UPI00359F3F54